MRDYNKCWWEMSKKEKLEVIHNEIGSISNQLRSISDETYRIGYIVKDIKSVVEKKHGRQYMS